MKDGITFYGIQLSNTSSYLDTTHCRTVRGHLTKINLDFRNLPAAKEEVSIMFSNFNIFFLGDEFN